MCIDAVADELLEADVVTRLKQILSASDAVVGLLHNSLMLVKCLCMIGRSISSEICLRCIRVLCARLLGDDCFLTV